MSINISQMYEGVLLYQRGMKNAMAGIDYKFIYKCPECDAVIKDREKALHNVLFVNGYPIRCSHQGDLSQVLRREVIETGIARTIDYIDMLQVHIDNCLLNDSYNAK